MWKRHVNAGNLKADLENRKSPKVLAFSRVGGVSVRVQEVGEGARVNRWRAPWSSGVDDGFWSAWFTEGVTMLLHHCIFSLSLSLPAVPPSLCASVLHAVLTPWLEAQQVLVYKYHHILVFFCTSLFTTSSHTTFYLTF